jgi:hypothetical protein
MLRIQFFPDRDQHRHLKGKYKSKIKLKVKGRALKAVKSHTVGQIKLNRHKIGLESLFKTVRSWFNRLSNKSSKVSKVETLRNKD